MKTKRPTQPDTISCHVRFPSEVYKWLNKEVPSRYRSVQERVIELARTAQRSDEERAQEQQVA